MNSGSYSYTLVMYNNSLHKTCMMYRIVYTILSYSFTVSMWYNLDILYTYSQNIKHNLLIGSVSNTWWSHAQIPSCHYFIGLIESLCIKRNRRKWNGKSWQLPGIQSMQGLRCQWSDDWATCGGPRGMYSCKSINSQRAMAALAPLPGLKRRRKSKGSGLGTWLHQGLNQ